MDLDSTDIEKRTFDVVRRGYDRAQVDEYLAKVSGSVARTSERRKLAEVRAEQLERQLHDLKHRADVTIQETVAARIRMLQAGEKDGRAPRAAPSPQATKDHAAIEAHQIIEQANVRATALQAEAEAVLEGALATSAKINDERSELLGSVGAERGSIIAAAEQEAQAIREAALLAAETARAAAAREVEEMRAEAARFSAETRRSAAAEAQLIREDAEIRAAGLVAAAERKRGADQSGTAKGSVDLPDEGVPTSEEPVESSRSAELERIMVDLRSELADEQEGDAGTRQARPSRYRSRSANLPHLGDDAASVIGTMGSLRTKKD
jgi:DivIVA domain-containing protein